MYCSIWPLSEPDIALIIQYILSYTMLLCPILYFLKFSYIDNCKYILSYSWYAHGLFPGFASIKNIPVLKNPAPFFLWSHSCKSISGKHLDVDNESITHILANTWYCKSSFGHFGGFIPAFPWYWLGEAYLYVFWPFQFPLLWVPAQDSLTMSIGLSSKSSSYIWIVT